MRFMLFFFFFFVTFVILAVPASVAKSNLKTDSRLRQETGAARVDFPEDFCCFECVSD